MSTLSQIGRYQLLERIALGGMAEIFLAFERGTAGFERLVVIKRLRQEFADDETYREMFLKEARTIARLNHPNIVKVHELGEHEGSWYIAMEYVAGSSFRELLVAVRKEKRKLPLNVAVGLLIRACAGAHGAHELRDASGEQLGLIHRDISPDNLMVEASGHVKLLDFGIAKVVTRDESTRIGTLKGKIAYMSPEQCQQLPLDRRSDVFSLGIVAWELITAERLFKRDSDYASMQAIVKGELKSLREHRLDCPTMLAMLVERALRVDPAHRFDSADEMRRELIELADRLHLDLTLDAISPVIKELLGEHQQRRAGELEAAVVAKLEGPDDLILDDFTDEEAPDLAPAPRPDRRPELFVSGALVVAGVVGMGIWSMQEQTPVAAPLEQDPVVEEPIPVLTGETLTIGVAPVMDEGPYLDAHEPLRSHLQTELNRPVVFRPYSSYDELGDALVEGLLDYASLPPFLYLRTEQRSDIELLATKLVDGSSGSDGVLLVVEDRGFQTLEDLQGATICFTDLSSTTGWLLPRALLAAEGVVLADEHHLSGNHLQALRDLQAGTCEVAATYSGAWLGADRAGIPVGNLRVLALTGRSPQDAMVAGPQAHPSEKAALKAALLDFEEPGAKGVERITGFEESAPEAYDALRAASELEPR